MTGALPTLLDQRCDGRAALATVLATSVYATPAQAVASLTLFTHPDTVAQIPGRGALFPTMRGRRRTDGEFKGRRIRFDDNETAHDAFGWCNPRLPKWRDIQLNHVWARNDPDAFTAPANLCAAPSFLAKLTDHDSQIVALLQRRSFELYGWTPPGEAEPSKPPGYDDLEWAPTLAATTELEAVLRRRLASQGKCTAALAAREIGWAFSGFEPDTALKPL